MIMELIVFVRSPQVKIMLVEGSNLLGESSWKDQRDLLEKLLPGINDLLTKMGAKITDVRDFRLDIDVPESYSTYRIAKATVETLKFCARDGFGG